MVPVTLFPALYVFTDVTAFSVFVTTVHVAKVNAVFSDLAFDNAPEAMAHAFENCTFEDQRYLFDFWITKSIHVAVLYRVLVDPTDPIDYLGNVLVEIETP